MADFDQMTNYANYIKDDLFRRGLHFPVVEEALGDLNRKRILDIGCGDGLFPRLLAERGASVVGYDRAPRRIADARAGEDAPKVDATFVVATPHTFLHDATFDAATSVMVLQLATSPEELAAFFRSASRHLEPGGRFISVVLNPLFSAFGQDFTIRRWTKLEGNRVKTEFLDRTSGRVEMTVEGHQYQYASQEYEQAAICGGMKPVAWRKLFATPDAVQQMGFSFWQPCHEHQPFALFVTQKELVLGLWMLARRSSRCIRSRILPRSGRCGGGGAGARLQPPRPNHALAAVADRLGGRAISPSSIVSTRSARVTASATSCVTKTAHCQLQAIGTVLIVTVSAVSSDPISSG